MALADYLDFNKRRKVSYSNLKVKKRPLCDRRILKMFVCSDFHDVTFVIGGEKIGANRAVLSATSDYFKMMLMGHFKESKDKEIPLEGVSAKVFLLVIKFCYLGQVCVDNLNDEELQQLAMLAHQYSLEILFRDVIGICRKYISIDNCLGWYEIATLTEMLGMQKACMKKLDEWFEDTNYWESEVVTLRNCHIFTENGSPEPIPKKVTRSTKHQIDEKKLMKKKKFEIDTLDKLESAMVQLFFRYEQLGNLSTANMRDLLKTKNYSINRELYFDHLFNNFETNSSRIASLIDSDYFQVEKMPENKLWDLLSAEAKARNNDDSFGFHFKGISEGVLEFLKNSCTN